MKRFSEPEISVAEMEVEDIITTSATEENPGEVDNGLGWG